jgi:ABC-type Zn uptake system ZnuABC Zn-binding protein ZnuA
MRTEGYTVRLVSRLLSWVTLLFVLSACFGTTNAEPVATQPTTAQVTSQATGNTAPQELPSLQALSLAAGERVQVVTTLNLIGDVVAQVGGTHIKLTTLLPIGVDPHSYSATPTDLRALQEAHVIFVIGQGLEEALTPVLTNPDAQAPLVSVNAGLTLMAMAPDGHEHGGLDPHTWTSIRNVKQWVKNIEQVLSALDPANATDYTQAAATYTAQLEQLESQIIASIATLPTEKRKLVTDHDVFGYFAAHYGFTVIGAVVPSLSTLAEPSAQELAALQAQIKQAGVKAIFVGSTANANLEKQLANDLGITVVPLYTESLSDPNGPAATYLDFMRYNVQAIVTALH